MQINEYGDCGLGAEKINLGNQRSKIHLYFYGQADDLLRINSGFLEEPVGWIGNTFIDMGKTWEVKGI